MTDIRPILSALRRHKTAAALIVLEIALTCAIICNAVFLIDSRVERMQRPSGLAEDELVQVQLVGIGKGVNHEAQTRTALAALRGIPGVRHAAATNQVPYGSSSWNGSLRLQPEQTQQTLNATRYLGSEELLETMGLRLVSGRDFTSDEYLDFASVQARTDDIRVPSTIISRALAERLFPDEDAIGKAVYVYGNAPTRVVGVVEHLLRPNDAQWSGAQEYSALFPIRAPTEYASTYLLRVDPGRRSQVLDAAVDTLKQVGSNRIVLEGSATTLEAMREDYYQADRAMAWMLVAVIVALLVVTALGIIGLASFWVQQRTRQIGVRRALGATRGQILRYFQVENFLLASLGIVLGMLLAYALNQYLMGRYELPRLPLSYLPAGAIVLWLLGQLAVLGPARRAASVPPAIATRSA